MDPNIDFETIKILASGFRNLGIITTDYNYHIRFFSMVAELNIFMDTVSLNKFNIYFILN